MEQEEKKEKVKEKSAQKLPVEPLRVRMLNLIADLEPIKKIKKGEGGAIYSHYAHNDVQQAVMALLPKHAIFMNTQPVLEKETGVLTMHARFECAYNPEDFVVTSTPVYVGNLRDEKSTGSAMSYALKYTLMRVFGLGGEEDADAKSAVPVRYINKEQEKQIEDLIKDDIELRSRIFRYYKVTKVSDIQEKDFNTILKGLMIKQPRKEAV